MEPSQNEENGKKPCALARVPRYRSYPKKKTESFFLVFRFQESKKRSFSLSWKRKKNSFASRGRSRVKLFTLDLPRGT
jgi:hypothetical protein